MSSYNLSVLLKTCHSKKKTHLQGITITFCSKIENSMHGIIFVTSGIIFLPAQFLEALGTEASIIPGK